MRPVAVVFSEKVRSQPLSRPVRAVGTLFSNRIAKLAALNFDLFNRRGEKIARKRLPSCFSHVRSQVERMPKQRMDSAKSLFVRNILAVHCGYPPMLSRILAPPHRRSTGTKRNMHDLLCNGKAFLDGAVFPSAKHQTVTVYRRFFRSEAREPMQSTRIVSSPSDPALASAVVEAEIFWRQIARTAKPLDAEAA